MKTISDASILNHPLKTNNKKSRISKKEQKHRIQNPFLDESSSTENASIVSSTSTLFDSNNPFRIISEEATERNKPKPKPPVRISSLITDKDIESVNNEEAELSENINHNDHDLATKEEVIKDSVSLSVSALVNENVADTEEQERDDTDTVTISDSSEGIADLEEVPIIENVPTTPIIEITETDADALQAIEKVNENVSDLRNFLLYSPQSKENMNNQRKSPVTNDKEKGFFKTLKRQFSLSKSSSLSKFKLSRSKSQENHDVPPQSYPDVVHHDPDLPPLYRTRALLKQHQRWSFAAPLTTPSHIDHHHHGDQYHYYYVLDPQQMYQQLPLKPEQLYQQLAPTLYYPGTTYNNYYQCPQVMMSSMSSSCSPDLLIPTCQVSLHADDTPEPPPQASSPQPPHDSATTTTTQCVQSISSTG